MNPATWAWVGLLITITGYVVAFDLVLQHNSEYTMSAQIHIWMQSELAGPIVVALWFGASIGLMYHFLINK